MAGVKLFTDLKIWQRARSWSKAIFADTSNAAFARDYRLVHQINDSSDSVMSNNARDSAAERRESSSSFSATQSVA